MKLTVYNVLVPAAFVILSCTIGHAQTWQTHYQAALTAWQQEDYSTAVLEAKQAMGLAASDPKGQAYARQIFTASCLATQQYREGLAEIEREIDAFKKLAPQGEDYGEAIHKKGQLQMGDRNFEGAAASFRELARFRATAIGAQSYEYFVAQAEEADALMQAKKYAEAQQAYFSSIAGFRGIPDAGEDYLYALFNSAYIDFTLSNKAAASEKLSELIAFLEQNNLQSYPEYEQSRQMLSRLNVSGEPASNGLVLPADRVKQLFDKAFALQDQDVQEALQTYRECEQIIAEHKFSDNTSFSCHLNYARLLFVMGDYGASAEALASARNDAAGLYPENSPEHGHVHLLAADLALHKRDVSTASQLYLQGIKALQKEKPAAWAKQIRWVSNQLIAARAGEEAIPVLSFVFNDPAFTTFEAADKITLHQLYARAHFESRQADQLEAYIQPRVDKENNPDIKQNYLLLLAQAASEDGNVTKAHALLQQGLTLAPTGLVAGELYFESARAYRQLGDYREAEIHYRKALEHIVRSPSAEAVTPLLFNSLATFYIQLGNYTAAEKFFRNLLSSENGSRSFYNAVRQNLAALYQQTGRYDDAKKLLLETLRLDAQQGTDHPDYAIALQNLAAVYQNLHELDSARLLYEQALAIDEKQFGAQSVSFATKIANLGTVYQEAGDFAGARTMFERALAIRKNLLSSDHPDFAYSQFTLANLLYRTQKPHEAFPLFRSAADFYIRQIHEVFPALSDYERTAFYNRVYEVIATYQTFLLENIQLDKTIPATLFNFRLQTKALLLNSSLKVRNQILQSGNEELIRDFHVWQHTKDQLAYLFSLPKIERDQHAALIDEFSQQADALEKTLSLKSESFSAAFLPASGDWRQIQSALKPGEGAVEILRVKLADRDSVLYAALVVKPGLAEPAVVVMPEGNFLEQKAFNGYINRMRYKVEDDVSYALFWKRLAPLLGDVHTLYFSPDGVYTKINCLTLYDAASKQYLVERKKIMLVSNLRDVVGDHRVATPPPAHALLVGFPDYRMDARQGLADFQSSSAKRGSIFTRVFRNSFDALPGTEKELQQVHQLLREKDWNVEMYLSGEALEEKVKESEAVTLLHIATHGFFVAPKDEHAKQVFSNDLHDIEQNAMLRSGLLLAGSEKNLVAILSGQPSSQVEDGILTAYEVMNLNLDHADLVVLSACETGTGDVKNGEGVYGLQRAFLLAGADHVVMSLWKVDDAATQALMSAFYSQWLGGKGLVAAFHAAQQELKAKFPHPFYWGAFVMMGNQSIADGQ